MCCAFFPLLCCCEFSSFALNCVLTSLFYIFLKGPAQRIDRLLSVYEEAFAFVRSLGSHDARLHAAVFEPFVHYQVCERKKKKLLFGRLFVAMHNCNSNLKYSPGGLWVIAIRSI